MGHEWWSVLLLRTPQREKLIALAERKFSGKQNETEVDELA
jgi:hypothetical protein